MPRLIQALFWIVFGLVLPPSVRLGQGVVVDHQGLGTVIHARAEIGDRTVIGPNVTIGGRSGLYGVPVIGEGVIIGAGARILGPVHVGRNAVIGANVVVVRDVPENAVAAGVPTRLIRINEEKGDGDGL